LILDNKVPLEYILTYMYDIYVWHIGY